MVSALRLSSSAAFSFGSGDKSEDVLEPGGDSRGELRWSQTLPDAMADFDGVLLLPLLVPTLVCVEVLTDADVGDGALDEWDVGVVGGGTEFW